MPRWIALAFPRDDRGADRRPAAAPPARGSAARPLPGLRRDRPALRADFHPPPAHLVRRPLPPPAAAEVLRRQRRPADRLRPRPAPTTARSLATDSPAATAA